MTNPTFTDLPADDDDLVDLSRPLPTGAGRFKLGPDRYEFAPRIPAGVLGPLMKAQRKLSAIAGEDFNLEPLFEAFTLVMESDSVSTLRARSVDLKQPVDHTDLMRILNYMLEVWGLRPTQPSSPSTTTSDDGTNGTTSTPGPSPEASPTTSDSTSATGSTSPTTGPSSTSNPSSTTS